MLRSGIYVDVDNIMSNGGYGLKYRVLREIIEAQGGMVVRANAYMSIDEEREEQDADTKKRRSGARDAMRREGFKLLLKPIKRYNVGTERQIQKANIDVDLTVDMLSADLDYYLLVTGDGDFVRLVEALQSRGKKVDQLGFANVSADLRKAADFAFNGYLLPGLLPTPPDDPEVRTGFLHAVNEEKGFGFITTFTGLKSTDVRDDIFVHISSIKDDTGRPISSPHFASLRQRQAILEFDIVPDDKGRAQARNVSELKQ
jgi:uncharacterized LabA/DUF88 family protein/cold shock CspA family protein